LSKNPVVALHLLENPQAVKGVPYADWKVDQWLSDGLAPGHVSNYYLQSDNITRRRRAVDNPTACIARLQSQVYVDDIHMKKRLAPLKGNTVFMFEVLARDKKASVRELVAKNSNCPGDVLKLLAEDKNNRVKMAAVQNRNFKGTASQKQVKSSDAEQLRNKGRKRDRIKIAKEAKRVAILADLAQDRSDEVRLAVAENEKSTAKVLLELIKDPDEKIRAAVARHQKTPDEERYAMLKDADDSVRSNALQELAWNRSKSLGDYDERSYDEALFEEMSSDPYERIQHFIARRTARLAIQEKMLAIGTDDIKVELAGNKFPHKRLAEQLKCDDLYSVRKQLLKTTTSEEVYLDLLAKYEDIATHAGYNDLIEKSDIQAILVVHANSTVRQVLAWYITDPAKLMQLAEDEDIKVREAVSQNEKLNKMHVDALLKRELNSNILSNLYFEKKSALKPHLPALMKHKSEEVRKFLAENLTLNSKLEEAFVEDSAPGVRQALISNCTGKLSRQAQEKLKADPDRNVRRILDSYY
jgi:hypothetical protein